MNKPIKFEDIQIHEWYWDNLDKIYFKVVDKRSFTTKLERNLFEDEKTVTKEVIDRVYPKDAQYGERLTYEYGRFYKYKEHADG